MDLESKGKSLNEDEVIQIIEAFKPKIKKSLFNTSLGEREDLEQEIKLKIVEKINDIYSDEVPGFFQFINSF
ncbi:MULTISPECIES: hypothetical protein [Bacillus]|uniref:helix-turn-helix domain-containing protein n=1 Tax=Bacillus TaxID=1386 RepID=UPI00077A6C37|nr:MULTISPECIES: hypothetical protein [Bacillus]KAB2372792.1 hypothetical protein F8510_24810 [Bacillus sp. RM2(2019)]KXY52292.1 hypothetical protein AT261_05405 [Bacillus cereus]PGW51478.1 hypothetical protein COE14_23770 [Bacillus thuringiensis]